jgi:putative transposase
MKKSKFSESQIVNILKEAETGVAVEDLSRQHGFSKATFYNWKAKYAGMSISEVKRMKDTGRREPVLATWLIRPGLCGKRGLSCCFTLIISREQHG